MAHAVGLAVVDIAPIGVWGEFADILASPLELCDVKTDKLARLLIVGDGDNVNIELLRGEWVPVRVDEENVVPLDEPEEQLEIVRDTSGERDTVWIADFLAEKEALLVPQPVIVVVEEVREDLERLGPPLEDRDNAAVRVIEDATVLVTELRGVVEPVIVNDGLAVVVGLEVWICDSRGELEDENVPIISDTVRIEDNVNIGVAEIDARGLDEEVKDGLLVSVLVTLVHDVWDCSPDDVDE